MDNDRRREVLADYLDQRVVLTGVFDRLATNKNPNKPFKVALLQDAEVELSGGRHDLGHVWLQHAETLSELQQGDRIQFAYTSPRDVYLAIVSIDAARTANTYYAQAGRAAPIDAANHRMLDQSTLLDDTLGPETLYALRCEQAIAVAPLLRTLEREPDRPPAASGCSVQRFALHKVAR